MRRNWSLCDVKIRVNETSIVAHKLVLSGCSPYFNFPGGSSDKYNPCRGCNDHGGRLGGRLRCKGWSNSRFCGRQRKAFSKRSRGQRVRSTAGQRIDSERSAG